MVMMRMPCSFANIVKLRHARHGTVFVHDFADDARRQKSRAPRQVSTDASVCPLRTSTPPSRGPQRKHVAGSYEVGGLAPRVPLTHA